LIDLLFIYLFIYSFIHSFIELNYSLSSAVFSRDKQLRNLYCVEHF